MSSKRRWPDGRARQWAGRACGAPAAFAACLVIDIALTAPAHAQSAEEFYRGKQIRLMVGSSPGGGYDAIARLVARHLGRHIPGHPDVIVQNTPGGGSIVLSNRIFAVEPQDGTVLGLVQRGIMLAPMLNLPSVQFAASKFNWIGSVSPETSLVVAWHTAPVDTVQDLFAMPLIVGGTGATSDLEASARFLNATVGAKFKIVSGYPGQADVLLAMERGEIQGSADWSWSEIKSRHADDLKAGRLKLILQNAIRKAPDLPDVPLAFDLIADRIDQEAAKLYYGLKLVARPIMAGPGVPADRIAALRGALVALKDDADYETESRKLGLDDPTPAATIDYFIELIKSASPVTAARLRDILYPGP